MAFIEGTKQYSWLQLSDLHLFLSTGMNVMEDSYKELSEVLHPDFLVVTGDYRYLGPKKHYETYDRALSFLNKITEMFKLKKESVFLVPGNHDVDSFPFRREIITTIQKEIADSRDAYIRYFYKNAEGYNPAGDLHIGFSGFEQFVRDFYGSAVSDNRCLEPSDITITNWPIGVEDKDADFQIIMLNSALICQGGDNTESEIIDVFGLSKLLNNSKLLPKIVVGHHPIERLAETQQNYVKTILRQLNTKVYLCGDEHQLDRRDISPFGSPADEKIPEIICGKSAVQDGDYYSDINVVYYTCLPDGKVAVQPYKYNSGEGKNHVSAKKIGFEKSSAFDYDVDKKYTFPFLRPESIHTVTCSVPVIASAPVDDSRLIETEEYSYEKQRFDEELMKQVMQPHFTKRFLKLGPNKGGSPARISSFITPSMFDRFFYVNRPDESSIDKEISDLFLCGDRNILLIEAGAGSGKTVFLNKLPFHGNMPQKYDPMLFDCADCVTSQPQKLISLLRHRLYVTFLECLQKPEWIAEFSLMIEQVTGSIDTLPETIQLTDDVKEAIRSAGELVFIPLCDKERLLAKYNKCSPKHRTFESFFKKELNNLMNEWSGAYVDSVESDNRTSANLSTNLLYIMLLLLSKDKRKKHLIAFDNLEVFVDNSAKLLTNTIKLCHDMLRQVFNISDEYRTYFYNSFTFVFMIRTANAIDLSTVITQHESAIGEVFPLSDQDFLIPAVLLKLIYLYKLDDAYAAIYNEHITNTIVFRNIRFILEMVLPRGAITACLYASKEKNNDEIKSYISNIIESTQQKAFIERHLMPMFNNNFRHVVDALCSMSSNDNAARLTVAQELNNLIADELNASVEIRTTASNGLHTIIYGSIFRNLHRKGILNKMGFKELGKGNQGFSISRAILTMLYWREIEDESQSLTPNGMSLYDFYKRMRYYYQDDTATFVQHLFNLCELMGDEKGTKDLIFNNWGNLVVITGLPIEVTRQDLEAIFMTIIKEPAVKTIVVHQEVLAVDSIRIKLSLAGLWFVRYMMRHFEFVLARGTVFPCTLFEFPISNREELQRVVLACRTVREVTSRRIGKFIQSSSKRCRLNANDCFDCVNESDCAYQNQSELYPVSCSLYQRYNEGLFSIVDCIDYIDRYRTFLFHTIKDKSFRNEVNNELLNQIQEYSNMFSSMEKDVRMWYGSKAKTEDGDSISLFFKWMLDTVEENRNTYRRWRLENNIFLRAPRSSLTYFNKDDAGKQYYLSDAIKKAKESPSEESLFSIWETKIASLRKNSRKH